MPDTTTETIKQKEVGEALFAEYTKNHSEETRNRIVEHYLYLAEILSKKYTGRGIDYDDLYQVASMALLLSAERFDPTRGFAFTSFATPTIIGEIKKYFRDKSWSVTVPRRVKELSLHLGDAREKLQAAEGKAPTVPELADYLGCSEEDVLEAMESGQTFRTYSLNQAIENEGEEGSTSLDKYMSINEQGYENFEDADLIQNVMEELTDKERAIFGDRVLGTNTQQEVAQEYGVSQMTISLLEAEIREKFRKEYYKSS
jgi:RNA polymerase sigma-B factor